MYVLIRKKILTCKNQIIFCGNGVFEKRRKEQVLKWVNDMAQEHLKNLVNANQAIAAAKLRIEAEVTAGKLPPTQAAKEIIDVMEHELFQAGR